MTLAVKDATGATQDIPFPNGNGQAPMAGSAPVVIASDQIVPVAAASLPLPTGAAADGNDGAGITPPAGGAGIRGWLSGIYSKLSNPLSVTGTFWQATQPVSLASLPALAVGSNSIGAITNSAFGIAGTLPAFAATPTVNIGTLPSIAVTGTFYQTTQPVSIASMPSTPVTGTFWQSVQPVSAASLPLPTGAAADGSDGTGITPPTGGTGIRGWLSGIYSKLSSPLSVTGNFWQSTQPVSIANMPPTPVTGTFWQATQPVSLTALPSLPSGANLIGAVNLDLGGSAVSATNPLPIIDAYTAPSASAWTSATALNSASTVTTGGYDTVIVTLVGNAALAGGTVAFEVFDGAAWIAVKAASVSDYTTAASASLTANMNRGYQVPVAGFPQFRVRLAGVISAGSVTITTIASSAPDTSIVTVGLDPAQPLPAGTNAIGTVLGPLPAAPITGQQTLTTTAAALPANALQNGLIVTALAANTGTVYVGAAGVSTATGYPLSAGQSISFAVANAGGISIIGTNATDKVAYAGN